MRHQGRLKRGWLALVVGTCVGLGAPLASAAHRPVLAGEVPAARHHARSSRVVHRAKRRSRSADESALLPAPPVPADSVPSSYHRSVWSQATDGRLAFVDARVSLASPLPADARLVFSTPADAPLLHDLLARELLASGHGQLLADDVLLPGRPDRTAAAQRWPDRTLAVRSGGVVELPSHQLLWPAPAQLIVLREDAGASSATRWSLTGDASAGAGLCLTVEAIAARDGSVTHSGVFCGSHEALLRQLGERLGSVLGSSCHGHPLVAALPVEAAEGMAPDPEQLAHDSQRLEVALVALGCRVQDVPPVVGAPVVTAPTSDGGEAKVESAGYRYDERLGAVVIPATLGSWSDGNVFVQVTRTRLALNALALRVRLKEATPTDWIDPDLRLTSDDAQVPFDRYDVKSVALATGELLTLAQVDVGVDTPLDVVSDVLSDVVTRSPARSWLEVHRLPADAELLVDGKRLGVQPAGPRLAAVTPGEHDVALGEGSHQIAKEEVTLGKASYGVVSMVVPFSKLLVTTSPAGAEVKVDGDDWGPSPVQRTVAAGSHAIVASRGGCGETTMKVEMQGGHDREFLLRLPGAIVASVEPKSAEILVDDKVVGTGTARDAVVAYGPHQVTFRLAGYAERRVDVDVRSCQDNHAEHLFQGLLAVDSDPQGADVRVDGQSVATTPAKLPLKAGTHAIRCLWCGYGAFDRTVSIAPGKTTDLSGALVTPPAFALELGADAGLLGGFSPGVEARVAGWLNGRFGLMGTAAATTGGSRYSGFLAARLLPFGPGWSLPVGVGLQYQNQTEGHTGAVGAARIEASHCLGGGMSFDFGAELTTAPTASLFLGLSWQSGMDF